MNKLVFWLCALSFLFGLVRHVQAEEKSHCRCNLPADQTHYGRVTYCYIDDWTDVPVFMLYGLPRSKQEEILVWKDGRIAWKDISKQNGSYFYKTKICDQRISDAVEFLFSKCKQEDVGGRKSETSLNALNILGHGSKIIGETRHDQFYKSDSWCIALFTAYEEERANFQTTASDELVAAFKRLERNIGVSVKRLMSHYNYVYASEKKPPPYSEQEVLEYAMRFKADAEYFFQFMDTVKSLVPNNEGLTSRNAYKKHGKAHIILEEQSSVGKVFRYTQCNCSCPFICGKP